MIEVTTLGVYNLENALKSAGLPKATDISKLEPSLKRGKTLGTAKPASGHDKYLRGIQVSFRIRAPRFLYQQLDTYHFIESISSQSTMHCLEKFDLHTMFDESTDPVIKTRFIQLVQAYKDGRISFEAIKASMPEGLLLYRDCITNYQQLKTVYYQRRHHRLKEWHEFCDWIEQLPMFKELVLGEENSNEEN